MFFQLHLKARLDTKAPERGEGGDFDSPPYTPSGLPLPTLKRPGHSPGPAIRRLHSARCHRPGLKAGPLAPESVPTAPTLRADWGICPRRAGESPERKCLCLTGRFRDSPAETLNPSGGFGGLPPASLKGRAGEKGEREGVKMKRHRHYRRRNCGNYGRLPGWAEAPSAGLSPALRGPFPE